MYRLTLKYLFFIIFYFGSLQSIYANSLCENILTGKQSTLSYQDFVSKIKKSSKNDNISESETLKILLATEYYDHEHLVPELLPALIGKQKLSPTSIERLWNDSSHNKQKNTGPFWNFLKAYKRFQKPSFDISVKTLRSIQRALMKDKVEGGSNNQLGKFRSWGIIGQEGYTKLAPQEIKEVNNNDYLVFYKGEKPSDFEEIWYVLPSYAKKKALNKIKNTHPKVFQEVSTLQKKLSNEGVDPYYFENSASLTRKLITALTEERISTFLKNIKGLQSDTSLSDRKKLIKYAAALQRDLVSIHPFSDGNGRTTRFFLNRILTKYGIFPIRIKDPNVDYTVSEKEWTEKVVEWSASSRRLTEDILRRIQKDDSISDSPYLSFIGLPKSAKLLEQKNYKNQLTNKSINIDWRQLPPYLKSLDINKQSLTIKEMDELVQQFIGFFQKHTIKYIQRKGSIPELVKLRLADNDFISDFAKLTANNKEKWYDKVYSHYNTSQLIWRGLSDQTYKYSDKDILDQFRSFTYHNLSNRRMDLAYQGYSKRTLNSIRKKLISDLLEYNADVVSGETDKMITDHTTMGTEYYNSYGLSTSLKESVAKRFAMGFLVVGTPKDYKEEENQKKLKSRISIAAFPAEKDININRLRIVDNDFRSEYPRQVEVTAIGAIDPDAVMLVQKYDAKGNVIESFVRNPNNPNEIVKIKGRWVPLENNNTLPDSSLILDVYRLIN